MMRLSGLIAHGIRLWVWCETCCHHTTLDPEPLLERLGDRAVPQVSAVLICSCCGSRDVSSRPDWPTLPMPQACWGGPVIGTPMKSQLAAGTVQVDDRGFLIPQTPKPDATTARKAITAKDTKANERSQEDGRPGGSAGPSSAGESPAPQSPGPGTQHGHPRSKHSKRHACRPRL